MAADGLVAEPATVTKDPTAPDAPAAAPVLRVKARVLVDGAFGKVNDVAELDAAVAEQAQKDGAVDTHPEAVAYAESLIVGDTAFE
jgi:hypothetical protein